MEGSRDNGLILVVEDDPDDVHMIRKCISRINPELSVEVRANGLAALNYLDQQIERDSNKLPDLVFLDLNMPVMDGNQFLIEMRQRFELKDLPVFVLTTSTDETILQTALDNGATEAVSKLSSLEGISNVINTIVERWFQLEVQKLHDIRPPKALN